MLTLPSATPLAANVQFTAAQIAAQMGVSRRQFFPWVNTLKAGGVARLLERDHGGGQLAQIYGPILTELRLGLQAGRWKRAKEIQAWLRQRHETRLTVKGEYYWLGKLGGVLKVPRKTHAHKDATASAEFQRTLWHTLESLEEALGEELRPLYENADRVRRLVSHPWLVRPDKRYRNGE